MKHSRYFNVTILLWSTIVTSYQYPSAVSSQESRQAFLKRPIPFVVAILSGLPTSPLLASARELAPAQEPSEYIATIQDARSKLDVLLQNWERATVQCNYADVPRDLLRTENKAILLEKAATSALFDKSASLESCKTSNRIVREYLGLTGKGPLVRIDTALRRSIDLADPDKAEDYVTELELLSQSLSRASSLSYMAGTADLDSMNNFDKSKASQDQRNVDSNLEQSRRAIQDAKSSLDRILDLILLPQ